MTEKELEYDEHSSRILNKVTGQVSEEFFRSQLLDELGSTNFDDDGTMWRICTWYIFTHTQRKQNNHIMTCILLHMS